MRLPAFMVRSILAGVTAKGIKASVNAAKRIKRNKLQKEAEWEEEQTDYEEEFDRIIAEEERRKNTPCSFCGAISESDFLIITKRSAKRFRRLKVSEIDGAKIHIKYYSQSGLSDYGAVIDFNDYGHITGKYWVINEHNASNLPTAFADYLSEQFIEAIRNNDNKRTTETASNSVGSKYTVDSTEKSKVTTEENIFPRFCRKCGSILDGKPYWCKRCGAQIRAKREWYCAVCGDHLNLQPDFSSESGLWTCTRCSSINRVKEQFY